MSEPVSLGPVTVLDLHFQTAGTVAAFLVRTPEGPVLVETGPESLFGTLETAVNAQGFALEDIRHVFLTHIHLDHSGAAWRLARHGAQIYVHPIGAPHLADPGKLLGSARRIYREDMERLWGCLEPIAQEQITPLEDGQVVRFGSLELQAIHTPGHAINHITYRLEDGQVVRFGGLALQAIHTPGHAIHHITYRLEDGLFTGDVGGIRLGQGTVIPPCPAPDIDLEAWADSIARMRAAAPTTIYPTHFGIKGDAMAHFDSLEENIHLLAGWIREQMVAGGTEEAMVPRFQAFMHDLLAEHGLPEQAIQDYETADPAFMSVYGLARYWRKREPGAFPA